MLKMAVMLMLMFALTGCATTSPGTASYLAQGKREFDVGNYKNAMENLLPLATDGNAEAQYAVGYMYYYGYGVAKDQTTGKFWVTRAANQSYAPAIRAMTIINKNN